MPKCILRKRVLRLLRLLCRLRVLRLLRQLHVVGTLLIAGSLTVSRDEVVPDLVGLQLGDGRPDDDCIAGEQEGV